MAKWILSYYTQTVCPTAYTRNALCHKVVRHILLMVSGVSPIYLFVSYTNIHNVLCATQRNSRRNHYIKFMYQMIWLIVLSLHSTIWLFGWYIVCRLASRSQAFTQFYFFCIYFVVVNTPLMVAIVCILKCVCKWIWWKERCAHNIQNSCIINFSHSRNIRVHQPELVTLCVCVYSLSISSLNLPLFFAGWWHTSALQHTRTQSSANERVHARTRHASRCTERCDVFIS